MPVHSSVIWEDHWWLFSLTGGYDSASSAERDELISWAALTIFLITVSHQSHQTSAKWHPSKTSALWLTGRLGTIQYIDAWWMWSTLRGIWGFPWGREAGRYKLCVCECVCQALAACPTRWSCWMPSIGPLPPNSPISPSLSLYSPLPLSFYFNTGCSWGKGECSIIQACNMMDEKKKHN